MQGADVTTDREMSDRISLQAIERLNEKLKEKGIDRYSDFSEFEIASPYCDQVKYVGNVHIPSGRVVKRSTIDRLFKRSK